MNGVQAIAGLSPADLDLSVFRDSHRGKRRAYTGI